MIRRLMTASSVTALVLLGALVPGCSAPPRTEPQVGGAELPGWVLVVPVEENGRNIFVGGCTMALSAREGVHAARTEAHLQITSAARTQFTEVFAHSSRDSGVETTSLDRLDFRELGFERYAEAMVAATRLDRVYLRSCLGGSRWENDRAPDPDEFDGEVCSVFVQISFDTDAWERLLSETLREMRHHYESNGKHNLAELADWIDGRLPEVFAEPGDEEQTHTGS